MSSMPAPEEPEVLPLSESDVARIGIQRVAYESISFPFKFHDPFGGVARITYETDTSKARHFKGKDTYEIEFTDIPTNTYRFKSRSIGADVLSKGAGGGMKFDIERSAEGTYTLKTIGDQFELCLTGDEEAITVNEATGRYAEASDIHQGPRKHQALLKLFRHPFTGKSAREHVPRHTKEGRRLAREVGHWMNFKVSRAFNTWRG